MPMPMSIMIQILIDDHADKEDATVDEDDDDGFRCSHRVPRGICAPCSGSDCAGKYSPLGATVQLSLDIPCQLSLGSA